VSLLEVEGLSVRFQTDDGPVQAVDDLSFSVDESEIVALVGESGCGKSVTAMALTRLLPSSAAISGLVRFAGQDLLRLPGSALREVRGRRVAYVFQEPMTALNPSFTVGFQIGEVLRRHAGLRGAQASRRGIELLELVGIPAPERRLKEYPHQLSGGMRQRVMIAMAVAGGPELLIADEPTTALDVTIQAGILDLIKGLRRRLRMAVLLITHDLGVVADAADRVLVMYAGRKVEEAAAVELFAAPRHPYTIGLLEATPVAAAEGAPRRLREIPGLVPTLAAPAPACVFAPRCGRADEGCRSRRPPLEPRAPRHLVACFHPGPETPQ
jgi:peptide/nickel transport system ATP-binding protein